MTVTKESLVEHPNHYGGENNVYETIKVIEAWDLNFNLGNVVKYISRAGKKVEENLLQDLLKAKFYLEREIGKMQNVGNYKFFVFNENKYYYKGHNVLLSLENEWNTLFTNQNGIDHIVVWSNTNKFEKTNVFEQSEDALKYLLSNPEKCIITIK